MTIEEITTRINLMKSVTRQDIFDLLTIYNDPLNERDNILNFLETLEAGIITIENIDRILNDLPSYKIKYKDE